MMKNNKWKLLLSSLVILLPAVFGLIVWNKLPDEMTTHWGVNGIADGWSSKPFAVFALPVILLLIHWLCVFLDAKLPGGKRQNPKLYNIVLWICPVISLFTNGMLYSVSLGKDIQPFYFVNFLLGILFIVIGNYLPKCTRSFTVGIKIKWTLENDENWNATHRFAGKVWVVGGLILMACVFLPESVALWAMFPIILTLVVIPTVYSYLYHKKQVKTGTATVSPIPGAPSTKTAIIVSLVITAVLLVALIPLMFTGSIDVEYEETSFTVVASYYQDLTVEYDAVTGIEYRDRDDAGSRVSGFSSARLLAGAFHNEEFGSYTRYSYTGSEACVVLQVGDKILVIGGADATATKEIYEQITAMLG